MNRRINPTISMLFLSCLLLLLPLARASAEGRGDAKPYGSGGCGLGSLIMGKNDNQVLAMTTNHTSDVTQTFAISSGTSNCVDSGVVRRNKQARAYIETNQQQIATDISKGHGESIAALAQIYGCSDEPVLSQALQRNFPLIFAKPTQAPAEVESAIENVIRNDARGACQG